jgi:AbrB family looped-hinge helix DNA binding protein
MTKVVVGRKGQVTLTKELREHFGIEAGSLVEEVGTDEGILIRPVGQQFERWKSLKRRISDRWPELSAVDAIRADRGDEV